LEAVEVAFSKKQSERGRKPFESKGFRPNRPIVVTAMLIVSNDQKTQKDKLLAFEL